MSERLADRVLRRLSKLCGVEAIEDDDTRLNRQRLILAEEDDPPLDDPVAQRAPYISPVLVSVAAETGAAAAGEQPVGTEARSDASAADAVVPVAPEPTPAEPASTDAPETEQEKAADSKGVENIENIMAQVSQLEEQGRLVEASALMARSLTLETPRLPPPPPS